MAAVIIGPRRSSGASRAVGGEPGCVFGGSTTYMDTPVPNQDVSLKDHKSDDRSLDSKVAAL